MDSHILNLYEITNAKHLRCHYRLIDVDGFLGDGDQRDENLGHLVTQLGFRERAPVARIRGGNKPVLAIPADVQLRTTEYQLSPHVVTLAARDEEFNIDFGHLTSESEPIALTFLAFAMKAPIYSHRDLWDAGWGTYCEKTSLNSRDDRREVDVYPGFGFRILQREGRLFVAVRATTKYVDARWLLDRYSEQEVAGAALKMKSLLYYFGHRWYPIQFLSLTGCSIAEQKFVLGTGETTSIWKYLRETWSHQPPNWIQSLDPHSPALSYRTRSQAKPYFAPAALCKRLLGTDSPEVKSLHDFSILRPHERFKETARIVDWYFQDAKLQDQTIQISTQPFADQARGFSVPALRFGQGTTLVVGSSKTDGKVPLNEIGRARMSNLLDPQAGFAKTDVLGPQTLLLPLSLPREIGECFAERLQQTVRQFVHTQYRMRVVRYDDQAARTLRSQVEAAKTALEQSEVVGRGVLVLPARSHNDLHNYLKRHIRDRFQFQCVSGKKLQGFFECRGARDHGKWVVTAGNESKFRSYLRNLAIGVLLVNQQTPWMLDGGAHFDISVGVDVLHNTAAFSFVFGGGEHWFVKSAESKQREKLLRSQMCQMIYAHLKDALADERFQRRSIILRRDGRLFDTEWLGFLDAIQRLIRERFLPTDVVFGAVEIHKHFASGLRLVAQNRQGDLRNPTIGSWWPLNDREGLLCTTGDPFPFRGTANPLLLRMVQGNLRLEEALEDTFRLSLLGWSMPTGCTRLPADLKLCDDFLRATAASADDDEALYGEDEPEGDTELEPALVSSGS